jgi:hypothetical protein
MSGGEGGFSQRGRLRNRQHGGTPRNNQAQNAQVDSLAKKYNLTPNQRRRLHEDITGQGFNYNEIEQILKDMFNH